MQGFSTHTELREVVGQPYRLRVLADLQQFDDPAGQRLAEAMYLFEIDRIRTLHHLREAA